MSAASSRATSSCSNWPTRFTVRYRPEDTIVEVGPPKPKAKPKPKRRPGPKTAPVLPPALERR